MTLDRCGWNMAASVSFLNDVEEDDVIVVCECQCVEMSRVHALWHHVCHNMASCVSV